DVRRRWARAARARGRRLPRAALRGRPRRRRRRLVAAAEGLPELPLGVLRRVEEPFGDLVLDGALRQPAEDEALPAPPREHGADDGAERNVIRDLRPAR